jgi:hypothetical protein
LNAGCGATERLVANEPLYELRCQVLLGATEIKKFSMTLLMNVPGKVRIIEGGVVPDASNRDRLGIFLYRGDMLEVRVLADGFTFEGTTYSSLSAVAKAITGAHCSGQHFFRLTPKGETP